MKKIAIITNIPAPYRVDLFYYMQTHITEYEFCIIYTSMTEDNRQWAFNEQKCKNSYILTSKIFKRRNDIDTEYVHISFGIMSKLRALKPDVVIAFEYNPAALQALMWCKIHNKKFIHLTDGTLHSELNIGKVQKLARYIITKLADACIASSTKAAEKLVFWGVPQSKIFISLLTIDITPFINLVRAEEQGRILYVGRIYKGKGLDLLLEALPYITTDYTLHIVGDGTDEEINSLKIIAREKGIEKHIVWKGYKEKEDLLQEYSAASVFVLPTRQDCFGLVLLEAMCARIPIIASKYADGAYDIVENGKNGYLVDPFNKEELAQALTSALEKIGIQNNTNSTESFEKFKFKNVTEGYLKAIQFCLNDY